MHRIGLIIVREYLTRIRRRSFLVMTLIGPLVMAAMMIVPLWLADFGTRNHTVLFIDDAGLFTDLPVLPEGYTALPYDIGNSNLHELASQGLELLYIPNAFPHETAIIYLNNSNDAVESSFKALINKAFYSKYGKEIPVKIIQTKTEQGTSQVLVFFAFGMSLLIYFFIFLYGMQIMKGVAEEKTNRIAEVMHCAVKPFEMMMGKILGIGLLAFTQFMIWLTFTLTIGRYLQNTFQLYRYGNKELENTIAMGVDKNFAMEMNTLVSGLEQINAYYLIGGFLCFFVFGYLLYAALFAVIGAAADADSDTQQFIFPLTVPLLSAVMFLTNIIDAPESTTAKVLSYIPFTSPIAMTARLPFAATINGFGLELLFATVILVITFLIVVWIAGRIYRIAIFSYGKRIGYADLVKWFFSNR